MGGGEILPPAYEYITDGLLLHLDSIYNEGWGTHVSNTKTWVDLSENHNDAISIKNVGIDFADNYAIFKNTDGFKSPASIPAAHSFTFEIWFRSSFNGYFVGNWGNSSTYSFNDNGKNFQYYGSSSPFNTGVGVTNHNAVTFDSVTKQIIIYKNGSVSGTYNNITLPATNNRRTSAISINHKADNNTFSTGQIYCLRFYNRALTSEEISFNTSLDNSRY